MTVSREGFNKNLSTGEIIDHQDKKHIVIKILNTSFSLWKNPVVKCDVVVQEIGSNVSYRKFDDMLQASMRYNLSKGSRPSLKKIGELITDNKHDEKPIAMIESIEKFDYEFVDLIVTYNAILVREWPKWKMDQAIKAERLSKFKVIG